MSEFYITMRDASGVVIGDGPLTNVLTLEDTVKLDAIGALTFSIPAEDERSRYIAAGTQFDAYDRINGNLGRFYYRSKTLDANTAGGARLVVNCHNQLIELARQSVHFRRTYTNQAVDNVVEDLIGIVAGWSDITDAGIGDTSVTYEGESVLRAIDILRDRWNQHFRLGAARVLEFGSFGDDSGIALTNLRGQVQSEIEQNTNVALVETIRLVEEGDEIFNKIIPLGAGQGTAQLTIEQATLGAYDVETSINEDGSEFFYIEDTTSRAAYGTREKVLIFPNIRPITNSDANIINAANALKLTAEAYMARHLVPKVVYAVTVRALRQTVNVGDLVRLQYRGIVDNYALIDVDELFYVMDVTRRRSLDGTRGAILNIATIAERRTSDTDIVLDLFNDIRALKVNVPISLSHDRVGPYTGRLSLDSTAEFTISFGAEVLALNYAKLRFRTGYLKSSVTSVSAAAEDTGTGGASSETTTTNGGATTSSGGSTHAHTLSITSTGLGSTGSSNNETSDANNTTHAHNVTVTNTSGGTALNVVSAGGGAVTARANGVGGNLNTEVNDIDHTHEMPHDHGIDHSHSGSTAANESAHTHTVGNHSHGMEHTHEVTVPEHTHELSYGVFQDDVLPADISVIIDGTDRTVELLDGIGLFAESPQSTPAEYEVDITEYLINAVGGLRQNHRIEFTADVGRGEIEMECKMLLTIMAIAVS